MRKLFSTISVLVVILLVSIACKQSPTPKPRGFFRIDLPEKSYKEFSPDNCPFMMEIPAYGEMNPVKESFAEPCWYNLDLKKYNATIYITYKEVENNLPSYIEDVRSIAYKHTIKADDIEETLMIRPEQKVYGVLYDIKGNAASSVNFFITDSTAHFLSGSLYFNSEPNYDSLLPAIQFFRKDIIHLMETTKWKN